MLLNISEIWISLTGKQSNVNAFLQIYFHVPFHLFFKLTKMTVLASYMGFYGLIHV